MTTLNETLEGVLDVHRWKSMGVASVECECGEIVHGSDSLTQFPADEAFRTHVAAEQVKALREYVQQAETVERAARALMAAADYEEGEYALLEGDALADLNQGTARALAAFTEAAS